jgi:hypothetical protein
MKIAPPRSLRKASVRKRVRRGEVLGDCMVAVLMARGEA